MVGILEFFSAPGFQKPFKADYTQPHWIVGIVYKLHTMTGSLLFFASCTIFIKELMHDHIHCIQDTNGDESKVRLLFRPSQRPLLSDGDNFMSRHFGHSLMFCSYFHIEL